MAVTNGSVTLQALAFQFRQGLLGPPSSAKTPKEVTVREMTKTKKESVILNIFTPPKKFETKSHFLISF
jgi:hypothetical protein